jgi:GAF domain-containing protein
MNSDKLTPQISASLRLLQSSAEELAIAIEQAHNTRALDIHSGLCDIHSRMVLLEEALQNFTGKVDLVPAG